MKRPYKNHQTSGASGPTGSHNVGSSASGAYANANASGGNTTTNNGPSASASPPLTRFDYYLEDLCYHGLMTLVDREEEAKATADNIALKRAFQRAVARYGQPVTEESSKLVREWVKERRTEAERQLAPHHPNGTGNDAGEGGESGGGDSQALPVAGVKRPRDEANGIPLPSYGSTHHTALSHHNHHAHLSGGHGGYSAPHSAPSPWQAPSHAAAEPSVPSKLMYHAPMTSAAAAKIPPAGSGATSSAGGTNAYYVAPNVHSSHVSSYGTPAATVAPQQQTAAPSQYVYSAPTAAAVSSYSAPSPSYGTVTSTPGHAHSTHGAPSPYTNPYESPAGVHMSGQAPSLSAASHPHPHTLGFTALSMSSSSIGARPEDAAVATTVAPEAEEAWPAGETPELFTLPHNWKSREDAISIIETLAAGAVNPKAKYCHEIRSSALSVVAAIECFTLYPEECTQVGEECSADTKAAAYELAHRIITFLCRCRFPELPFPEVDKIVHNSLADQRSKGYYGWQASGYVSAKQNAVRELALGTLEEAQILSKKKSSGGPSAGGATGGSSSKSGAKVSDRGDRDRERERDRDRDKEKASDRDRDRDRERHHRRSSKGENGSERDDNDADEGRRDRSSKGHSRHKRSTTSGSTKSVANAPVPATPTISGVGASAGTSVQPLASASSSRYNGVGAGAADSTSVYGVQSSAVLPQTPTVATPTLAYYQAPQINNAEVRPLEQPKTSTFKGYVRPAEP